MPTPNKPNPWSRLGLSSSIHAPAAPPLSQQQTTSSTPSTKPKSSPRNHSQQPDPRSRPFNSSNNGNSRLRPPTHQQDPLEAAGLPSKGDTTLLDLQAQEQYFATLMGRYMDYCAETGVPCFAAPSEQLGTTRDQLGLEASMQEMSLAGSARSSGNVNGNGNGISNDSNKELAILHMSMRKLREALLSTRRIDSFAQQVYVFIIRASILSQTWESYHPALLHVLYVLHPAKTLAANMLHEILSYYILDTACRKGDLAEARRIKSLWAFQGVLVERMLRSLVRDDWVEFWKVSEECDGYQRILVKWAEAGIRKHALKCLGRSYHRVSKEFVERAAGGMEWRNLVQKEGVGWEEDQGTVVIKRLVRKT